MLDNLGLLVQLATLVQPAILVLRDHLEHQDHRVLKYLEFKVPPASLEPRVQQDLRANKDQLVPRVRQVLKVLLVSRVSLVSKGQLVSWVKLELLDLLEVLEVLEHKVSKVPPVHQVLLEIVECKVQLVCQVIEDQLVLLE